MAGQAAIVRRNVTVQEPITIAPTPNVVELLVAAAGAGATQATANTIR